jgi:hypothetical protein
MIGYTTARAMKAIVIHQYGGPEALRFASRGAGMAVFVP